MAPALTRPAEGAARLPVARPTGPVSRTAGEPAGGPDGGVVDRRDAGTASQQRRPAFAPDLSALETR